MRFDHHLESEQSISFKIEIHSCSGTRLEEVFQNTNQLLLNRRHQIVVDMINYFCLNLLISISGDYN